MSINQTVINEYTTKALNMSLEELRRKEFEIYEEALKNTNYEEVKELATARSVYIEIVKWKEWVLFNEAQKALFPGFDETVRGTLTGDIINPETRSIEKFSINIPVEQMEAHKQAAKKDLEGTIDYYKREIIDRNIEARQTEMNDSMTDLRALMDNKAPQRVIESAFKKAESAATNFEIASIGLKRYIDKKEEIAAQKKQDVKPVVPARPSKDALAKLAELTKTKDVKPAMPTRTPPKPPLTTQYSKPIVDNKVSTKGLTNLDAVKDMVKQKQYKCEVTKKDDVVSIKGKDAYDAAVSSQDLSKEKLSWELHVTGNKEKAMISLAKAVGKGLDISKCTFTENGKTQEVTAKEISLIKKASNKRPPEAPLDGTTTKKQRI